MQRLRRFSISSSPSPATEGANPPSGSSTLHRSSTTTSLASQRSPLFPFDSLRRTPSSHLLSSTGVRVPAATAVCTAVPAQATVVRAPSLSRVSDARPLRLTTYGSSSGGRSTSHSRAASPAPSPLPGNGAVRSSPIPISPTSPSAQARRRDSATASSSGLAAAIRSGDTSALRSERRRTELVDSRFVRGAVGAVAQGDLSDEGSASGESYEVEVVDTRGRTGGAVIGTEQIRSASTSRQGSIVGAPLLVKPTPRYSNGRRLSCLATYEGLPIPAQLRARAGRASTGAEPELTYSLHGLRNGGTGPAAEEEHSRARRLSNSAPPPPMGVVARPAAVPHRPSSPAPEAFKSSGMSPLTSSSGSALSRRPSSPGPGLRPTTGRSDHGAHARRASSPVGPRPNGLVLAAPPSAGSRGLQGGAPNSKSQPNGSRNVAAARAPSPSPGSGSARRTSQASVVTLPTPPSPRGRALPVRAPSPAHAPSGTRVVYGFDAPVRTASPGRRASTAPGASFARPASPSLSDRHAHSMPIHLPTSPAPVPPSHATTTRPRSRMADQHADERLEVLASRDFAVLDEYYSSRRRGDGTRAGGDRPRGEKREVKKEVEERLRRGYDRASLGAPGR